MEQYVCDLNLTSYPGVTAFSFFRSSYLLDSLHPNLMTLLSKFFTSVARKLSRGTPTGLSLLVRKVIATIIMTLFALAFYSMGKRIEN